MNSAEAVEFLKGIYQIDPTRGSRWIETSDIEEAVGDACLKGPVILGTHLITYEEGSGWATTKYRAPGSTKYKCATVGCRSKATEVIDYLFSVDPRPNRELVCTPCAASYERRVVLSDVKRRNLAEYKADYRRGWEASRSGSDTALDRADARGEVPAWYDGWNDQAATRKKWHLLRCTQHDSVCGVGQ